MSRRNLQKKPLIYLITEGRAAPENFREQKNKILSLTEIAASAQISLIQIREKNLSARLVFELTRAAVEITRATETKILVNDRADIALAAGADGVHLTGSSLSASIVRRHFPPPFIVGASAHTPAEAENAEKCNADFVTFSPIFATPSKEKYGAPQGLAKLQEVCEALGDFPVIALGGIDENNYKSVLENGARGFAAIRFLNDAGKLKRAAADLRGFNRD